MKKPNLSNIVETHVPINDLQQENYFTQLRNDVLKPIRKLKSSGDIEWYSFLLHQMKHITDSNSGSNRIIFHIRLEPSHKLSLKELIGLLPAHFIDPHPVTLDGISGLDNFILKSNDWAEAWRVIGESSEWVLNLIESHVDNIPPEQAIQFIHFITNPLGLGHKCVYAPSRISF